jgi:hypothetical protein
LFFGLAGESDDDVGGDGTIWNAFADLCHEVAVLLLGVSALHVFEHFVIARLNGQFDVRHDARKFGDGLNEIVVKVIGVRGQEADAFDAFDFVQTRKSAARLGPSGMSLP